MNSRSQKGASNIPHARHGGNTMNRRRFIIGTTLLAGAASSFGNVSASFAATTDMNSSMVTVTELLAGKTVDAQLCARAGSALTKVNADFPEALAALAAFIQDKGIADSTALGAAEGFAGPLQDTAKEILKAVYLGYAGEPKAHAAHDNVEFITFSQALSFGVTSAYVPIPSYSSWGSGYWADLPEQG